MAVKNLSLVLSAGGTVAGSLPRTFNRAAREVQRLRDRQLEVRTELRKQQGALKRTSEGTVEYARTSSEVDRLKQSLADMGVQQRDAELSSRRFNQNLGRAKGLLLGVGGAAGVALTGIVALGKFTVNTGQEIHNLNLAAIASGVGLEQLNRNIHRNTTAMGVNHDAAVSTAVAQADHYKRLQLLRRGIGQVDASLIAISGYNPYEASSLGAQELDTHVLQLIRDLQQQDNVAGLAALEQQLGAGAFAGYLAQAQKVPGAFAEIDAAATKNTQKLIEEANAAANVAEEQGKLGNAYRSAKAAVFGLTDEQTSKGLEGLTEGLSQVSDGLNQIGGQDERLKGVLNTLKGIDALGSGINHYLEFGRQGLGLPGTQLPVPGEGSPVSNLLERHFPNVANQSAGDLFGSWLDQQRREASRLAGWFGFGGGRGGDDQRPEAPSARSAPAPSVNVAPAPVGLPAINVAPAPVGLPAINVAPGAAPNVNVAPAPVGLPAINVAPAPVGLPAINVAPAPVGLPAINVAPGAAPNVNVAPAPVGLPAPGGNLDREQGRDRESGLFGGFFRNLFGGGDEPAAEPVVFPSAATASAIQPSPEFAGGGFNSGDSATPEPAGPTQVTNNYTITVSGVVSPDDAADVVMRRIDQEISGVTAGR